MFSFYCKLFVMYMLFTTVMCYAEVTSVECVNFENEPYCYDAGYMTIRGKEFVIGGYKDVFKLDDDGVLYFLIDQTVSNSTYIYGQFAYDKAAVPQGPHIIKINDIHWSSRSTMSVLYGGFYNSDIPVWTKKESSTWFYTQSQSTNYINNQTILEITGSFKSIFDHEVHFYCTEPGYKGMMPRCSLTSVTLDLLKCSITDAIPTNYTFRYVVREVGADWWLINQNMLPELHIV